MVDKRALDEERARRKKAEASANEARVKYETDLARAQTRLDMIQQAIEAQVNAPQPQQLAQPAPEFDKDPKSYIEHEFAKLRRQQEELAEKYARATATTTQLTQQQQEAQQIADLERWAMAQESAFARETTDYSDAMKFLAQKRESQLRAIGIDDPGEINSALSNDVRGLANLCRQRGKPFGEALYNLAKANGYNGASSDPVSSPNVVATPGNRETPDSAAERLLRGADMAATIGSIGAAPRGEPAASAIATMSDEQFATLYNKIKGNPAAMRQLFGT
jgi:hypothetical protein